MTTDTTPTHSTDADRQLLIGEPVGVLADNLPEQWRADWFDTGIFYIARIEACGDSINYTISDTWPIKRGFHGSSCLTDGFAPDQLRSLASQPTDRADTAGLAGELEARLDRTPNGNTVNLSTRNVRQIIAALHGLEAESAALRDMLREAVMRGIVAPNGRDYSSPADFHDELRDYDAFIARIDALTKDQGNG